MAAIGILGGCDTPPPPGELVGRYRVSGALEADSCGPGLGANRSIAFDVELREDDASGYWLFGDRAPSPGTLDDEGNFLFQQRGGWTLIDPRPELGYAGCHVTQLETIDGKIERDPLALTADDDALTGSNTIDVVPVRGDDCSPALASQGGPFFALPCRIEYEISGVWIGVEATLPDFDGDAGSR